MYECETKAERFRRLAEARTNAVIERVRLLGNLSNRASYEYTEEEVERMFKAINDALRISRARFRLERPKRFRRISVHPEGTNARPMLPLYSADRGATEQRLT